MDAYESEKNFTVDNNTPRPPLVPAERNNVVTTGRPRKREVSSRYKSPCPSTTTRRFPSPSLTRTVQSNSQLVPKRSLSADRKRPLTPPSPPSRRMSIGGGRSPEGLWPSTMRSLSVSFQSDSISIPVSKKEKEKPVRVDSFDGTLRPNRSRNPTPERKITPLICRNESENANPNNDGLHSRLIDQHRWPSRTASKISTTNLLSRSIDSSHKSVLGTGLASHRCNYPLKKSVSDVAAMLLSHVDACKPNGLSTRGSRASSPSKPSGLSSSIIKGASPCRARPSTPPSRGVSPSRIKPSSSCVQGTTSASVLTYMVDMKKGKRGASYIEDACDLRLLYNRHLQWRFANARAEVVLYFQKVHAEKTMHSVWNNTLTLRESIIRKRTNLRQLKLQIKLSSVCMKQMAFLDDWVSIEEDHSNSISGAVEDLKSSTLRLPLNGGAKADIESLNTALCSAIDVMQAMESSIYSLHSRAQGINTLISELAIAVAQERAMLVECEMMLASTCSKQVEECSLRTHRIQIRQALVKDLNTR